MSTDPAGLPRPPIQRAVFLGLVLGASLTAVWLVWDLLTPIFWAVVLAILFHPLFRWIRHRVRGRSGLAAGLSVLSIVVLVLLPLAGVGVTVGGELAGLYQRVESGELDLQAPLTAAERLVPAASRFIDQLGIDLERIKQSLSAATVSITRFLAAQAFAIGQNAIRIVLLGAVMLYLLFFFLRDGDRLLDIIVEALPLGDERERRLLQRFTRITRATIKGTLIVGVVQGGLGGILFAILGIPAAAFWGVMMTILSLLPAVGSGIVWAPAAVILMLTGSVAKGVILLLVGVLVIGMVDNVLRPVLVGRETQMPDWVVLLAILGGLAAIGLSGFVIGPILAGLFLTVWQMFAEEYGAADGAGPPPAPPEPPPLPEPPLAPTAADAGGAAPR